MGAIPLDLHQNDLKGKPVHGDQHMIQFLILNTIQKVLYCFQFCLISGCCYGIQICTCSIMASVIFLYHISNPEKNLGCRCRQSFTWKGCFLKGRRRSISISMILSSLSPDCLFGSVILTPFLQDSGNKKCLPGTFIDSRVPNRHCCLTISCS